MGIPKFFRWLRERYPGIEEALGSEEESCLRFDNLYLDMNGLIHNAAAAAEGGSNIEDRICYDTCAQVDAIVHKIKPQKILFLAIDGVSPCAKMNQQRERRYRSAWERQIENLRKEHAQKSRRGAAFPTSTTTKEQKDKQKFQNFDSNWITPGTPFLFRFGHYLLDFVKKKCETDKRWQHLEVVVSTSEQPGEGEHKIADFIRQQKRERENLLLRQVMIAAAREQEKNGGPQSQRTVGTSKEHEQEDLSMSHCLYGLDADLVMLALMSHEQKFAILREALHFDRGEVSEWDARWKLEARQNEFVLIHIGLLREYLHCELPIAWVTFYDADSSRAAPSVWVVVGPYRSWYDLERVIDDFVLINMLIGNDFLPSAPFVDVHQGDLGQIMYLYRCYLHEYEEKMAKYRGDKTDTKVDKLCEQYCEGLLWNMKYYYRGVSHAGWMYAYPHHYAPFFKDLKSCEFLKSGGVRDMRFRRGGPCDPFEQLVRVLPLESAVEVLPREYLELMANEEHKRFFAPIAEAVLSGMASTSSSTLKGDGVTVPWGGKMTNLPFVDPDALRELLKKTRWTPSGEEKKRNKNNPTEDDHSLEQSPGDMDMQLQGNKCALSTLNTFFATVRAEGPAQHVSARSNSEPRLNVSRTTRGDAAEEEVRKAFASPQTPEHITAANLSDIIATAQFWIESPDLSDHRFPLVDVVSRSGMMTSSTSGSFVNVAVVDEPSFFKNAATRTVFPVENARRKFRGDWIQPTVMFIAPREFHLQDQFQAAGDPGRGESALLEEESTPEVLVANEKPGVEVSIGYPHAHRRGIVEFLDRAPEEETLQIVHQTAWDEYGKAYCRGHADLQRLFTKVGRVIVGEKVRVSVLLRGYPLRLLSNVSEALGAVMQESSRHVDVRVVEPDG
eukprot:g7379.t1